MKPSRVLHAVVVAACVLVPALARASLFFDRNSPGVEWKTFETEHFVFHYYDVATPDHPSSTAFTARRAARYAEIVYPKVCAALHATLHDKVHVVVRDQDEYSNGFAIYQADWITIWATPLYYRFRGRLDWIPDVLAHELAHVVAMKANDNRGIGMSLASEASALSVEDRSAVGVSIPFGDGNSPPHWWTEGSAELWTQDAGWNRWTPSRDMLLRMSMLEPDMTFTLDELSTPGSYRGFDTERGYNHGYALGLWLRERYGNDVYERFAEASAKKSRVAWESVIRDVLGVSPDEMWAAWVAAMRDRYRAVTETLEKEGLHAGTEVAWKEPMWLSADEAVKARWSRLGRRRRREEREREGQTNYLFRVAPDGSAFGYTARYATELRLTFLDPDELPAFTGHWLEAAAAAPEPVALLETAGEATWAALPDREKLARIPTWTLRGLADDAGVTDWSFSPDGSRLVVAAPHRERCWGDYDPTGVDFNDLVVVDLSEMKMQAAEVRAGLRAEIALSCGQVREAEREITREARATQPDWSPDGQWIVFVQYGDGTTNLARIHPDGTGFTRLTNFREGEQVGEPRVSPDGRRIVFWLWKPATNDQQDLWLMDVDGTNLKPLTWDKAEDKDPAWTADGRAVLWSSDRTGIFDVYRIDIATGNVVQVTNVVGGAFAPALTKKGNLLYTGFDAFGFQNYGLKRSDFYEKRVDLSFHPAEREYDAVLAKEEELPPLPPARAYSAFRDLARPSFVPIARYEGSGVQGGGELLWWDYVGKHSIVADVLVGANQDYGIRYVSSRWAPDLTLAWAQYDRTERAGISRRPGTSGALEVRSQTDWWLASAMWKLGDRTTVDAGAQMRSFDVQDGSRGGSLHDDTPFSFGTHGISSTAEGDLTLRHVTDAAVSRINPRDSRTLELALAEGYTALPGGDDGRRGRVDDGERLRAYPYGRVQLAFTDAIPAPWLVEHEHTIELSARAGFVDRNVQLHDELFAGGRHPASRINQVDLDTPLAGYAPFSLSGETELFVSGAYRLPVARDLRRRIGPFFLDDVYLQFSATAGNLWSYRPRPTGGRLAVTEDGNVREMPFAALFSKTAERAQEEDYASVAEPGLGGTYGARAPTLFERAFPVAYKNGNRLLTDVAAEVRVRAFLFHYDPWFSFVRVAYGFQDVTGSGTANGDFLARQLAGTDAVGPVQPHGVRLYVGLGTGW